MPGDKVSALYLEGGQVRLEQFEALLASAEGKATDENNEWAQKFVADMKARYEKYKGDTYLSEKQADKLREIAEGRQRG